MATSRVSPVRSSVRFSPTTSHSLPRSMSRSPDRSAPPKFHTIDPLLSNLSPESTLLALTSTDAVPKNEKAAHDILWKSISQVSPAERALGIRAAVAAQKLGEWYREVQSWDWPKRADAQLGKGFMPRASSTASDEHEYYGSLPSVVVKQHEDRIEEIRDGMDSLDVDELKEHVLNAHIPARSRPSSSNSTMSVPPPLSYVQLSDFTAVITATILRALPLLSRLNNLLSTWDARLLVLRQIPGLLRALHLARSEVDSAMDLLKSSTPPSENDALYSRDNYHAKQAGLEAIVLSAGRRMDNILDALDGREDSLPESWIDDLEAIESDFSTWVMEAEKRTVENEWLQLRAMTNKAKEIQRAQCQQNRLSNIPEEEDSKPPTPGPSDVVLQSGCSLPLKTIEEDHNDICVNSTSDTISHSQSPLPELNASEPAETRPTVSSSDPMDLCDPKQGAAPEPTQDLVLPKDSPEAQILVHTASTISTDTPQPEPLVLDGISPEDALEESLDDSSHNQVPHSAHLSQNELPVARCEVAPWDAPVHEKVEAAGHIDPINIAPRARVQEILPVEQSRENNSVESNPVTQKEEVSAESECPVSDNLTTNQAAVVPPIRETEQLLDGSPLVLEANQSGPQVFASALGVPPSIAGLTENSVGELKQESLGETGSAIPKHDSCRTSESATPFIPGASASEEQRRAVGDTKQQPTSASSESINKGGTDQSPLGSSIIPSPGFDRQLSLGPPVTEATATQISCTITDSTSSENKSAPETLKIDLSDCQDLSANAGPTVVSPGSDNSPIENEAATLSSLIAEAPTTEISSWVPMNREDLSSVQSTTSSPKPPNPSSSLHNERETSASSDQHKAPDTTPPRKNRLESPIKLSKSRPQSLNIDKGNVKSRARHTSTGSTGSLSDYPSLLSSPEIREPRTASSNGTPLLLETPPHLQSALQPSDIVSPDFDYTLMRRMHSQKGPGATLAHSRTLSLPLQRFINERLNMQYESEATADPTAVLGGRRASDASVDLRTQNEQQETQLQSRSPSTTTNSLKLLASQHLELSQEKKSASGSDDAIPRLSKAWEHNKNAFLRNAAHQSLPSQPAVLPNVVRLQKRLTTHPSLESIGAYKTHSQSRRNSITPNKAGSRSSTPSRQMRRPKDQLDEKISSILTTIPARIHLVSSEDRDVDESPVAPSLPLKHRERFRSMTLQGASSRSSTPTPSLTLTPAPSRRRHSHAPEEGSVKLYHLHRGGKATPTKLFIRTVGENGERVMVRVGGGWADLAEYLREYAIHHGCRTVTETPRVEVQGLSPRESPARSSPGITLTPTGNSGRRTPSRPASVLSNRPPSSLAVRKARRTSNVSDALEYRSFSSGHTFAASYSPLSTVSSRRRFSVSSSNSFGGTSLASDIHHGSFTNSPSMPLGLAGPTPRSRRVSISPEGEAWVEDVLGRARRSSSLRPVKYTMPPHELEQPGAKVPTLPKSRSIGDIGKAGSSRRVALRGLANPRPLNDD